MMGKVVLVTGFYSSLEKGGLSILKSFILYSKKFGITRVKVLCPYPQIEKKEFRDWKNVELIKAPIMEPFTLFLILSILPILFFCRKIFRFKGSHIKFKELQPYTDSDLVVDLSGDSLSEVYGIKSVIYHITSLLPAVLLEKKFAIISQTIDNLTLTKFIYKFIFKRAQLLTVRERESFEFLKSMGVDTAKVRILPDLAFLLPVTKNNRIKNLLSDTSELIGICVHRKVAKTFNYKETELLRCFAELLDYIIKTLNVKVLFIPHSYGIGSSNDDRIIQKKIISFMSKKDRVLRITKNYKPEIIKYIISRCAVLITTRMHPAIAAASTGTIPILIGDSCKLKGLARLLGIPIISSYSLKESNRLGIFLKKKIKQFMIEKGISI